MANGQIGEIALGATRKKTAPQFSLEISKSDSHSSKAMMLLMHRVRSECPLLWLQRTPKPLSEIDQRHNHLAKMTTEMS